MTKNTNDLIESIITIEKLIEFISEKRYSLADIGLKNKQAFDWTKAGIFLEQRESKYRRTYNSIEYVWLKIVKELREFGLSIDSIRNLKSFLLKEVDIKEYMTSLIDVDLENESKELKELQETLRLAYGTEEGKEQLIQSLSDKELTLVNTVLTLLIIESVVYRTNAHLLITKEGNTIITDGEPFDDEINLGEVLNAPYITFPLRNVLVDFINREDLMSLTEKEELLNLSEQEQKVLRLLRLGNLVSLSVRFDNNNEISLIETEENIDLSKVQGRLADFILRNQYHTITYKTQAGKIINMRRTTLHK